MMSYRWQNRWKEDVCIFFDRTRQNNPKGNKTIILNNFKLHRLFVVRESTEELHIGPVPLSPYSPDLNPIEFLWKSIRRIVSITFIQSEWYLKRIIEVAFLDISQFNLYSIG